MTEPERPYPELDELAVPAVEPLSYRVTAIEKLADSLAETADKLRMEFKTLTKNLDSIVGYLREISQWKGEMAEWRERVEGRIRELERSDRSRPPSST
jgi:hypothetical protein